MNTIQSIERAAAILRLLSGPWRRLGVVEIAGNELRTRALNWSDSLAARTNESVHIGTLNEGRVLIVHHVFRPDDSRRALEVGALLPAQAGC